jgi:RNA-directed DNA polymerase
VARTARQDKVRELQRTLYRAAKADPGRRFHALYDKVYRRDVLERAWELVRANKGAAGIDRQTIADVERYGIDRLLDELAADLKDGSYRPLAARRVFIPKPGSPTEQRPLSIPTVIAYCCVVQRASGFVGGHASVPSVVRAAARGPVCAS